ARRFVSIAVFEANLLRADRGHERIDESAVRRLDRLGAAAFVVADQSCDPDASRTLDASTSSWFDETARVFEMGEPVPRAPVPSPAAIAARASVVVHGPLLRRSDAMEQAESVAVERGRRYSLAELIDLAQRINPETREAWEQARQAALAVGLVESSYAPQIS